MAPKTSGKWHGLHAPVGDTDTGTGVADAVHVRNMQLALEQARLCEPSPTAFCVGCVIVDGSQLERVLAVGFSRELPGNTHAEQCALDKLERQEGRGAGGELVLYTTMEPCSTRLSGNAPCVQRILANAHVKHVLIGVDEPDDFVACQGTRLLREHGVDVRTVEGFAEQCLSEARRGR